MIEGLRYLVSFGYAYLKSMVQATVVTLFGWLWSAGSLITSSVFKVFILFLLGNTMLDIGVWKILEPYQNFRWVAVFLVGIQLLQLATIIENNG